MPNDSNWISLTCKVILYERLCNKIGFQAMGNIMQLLASRLLSFPQQPHCVSQSKPSECSYSNHSQTQYSTGSGVAKTGEKTQSWKLESSPRVEPKWSGSTHLVPTQATPKKQSRFLTAATSPKFMSQCMHSDYTSPTGSVEQVQKRAGAAEVGHSDRLWEAKGSCPQVRAERGLP